MQGRAGTDETPSGQLEDAYRILEKARAATALFMDVSAAMTQERRSRGATRGRLTDDEHDLRRAAIVFAGAGLDAVVKQLLADAGNALITPDFLATSEGRHFLNKVGRSLHLSGSGLTSDEPGSQNQAVPILLAELLMSPDPRSAMCKRIVAEMTGGSFQSVERLLEVCNVFGLQGKTVVDPRKKGLQEALKARNTIVHEMDVDLSQKTRSRRGRSEHDTRAHVEVLLDTAEAFLGTADRRLKLAHDSSRTGAAVRRR